MYEKKYLILIKGEDKTSDVTKVRYEDGMWIVTFTNDNTYKYGYTNVEKMYGPEVINTKDMEIQISGKHVYNVYQILVFKEYAKLLFTNNTSRVCYTDEMKIISIEEGYKSTDVFKYLREIAHTLKIKIEDDTSFLGNQFEQIDMINDKSILHKYISKRYSTTNNESRNIILPFGFNISQEKATRNAINNKISIIEGPPGTGKTQTIMNVIANAIIMDKTVAVVSNNNSATVNVQEKLKEYDLSFISAFLGSRENKDKFLSNQLGIYPNMSSWSIEGSRLDTLYYTLKANLKELLFLNKLNNDKSESISELNSIKKEYSHFKKSSVFNDFKGNAKIKKQSPEDILNLIYELSLEKKISRRYKMLFFFKYKIKLNNIYSGSHEESIERLNHSYYLVSIKNYENLIEDITVVLSNINFDKKKIEYQQKSMQYFKAILYEKYHKLSDRRIYSSNDLYLKLDEVLLDYPVILSTTHSLKSISLHEYMYDYVIVDESSQADIVSSSLALSIARNTVIVGDSMQLPHVVNNEVKRITSLIFDNYNIDDHYKYTNSLLDSFKSLYESYVPVTLLEEHYRCNPEIIGYCNKKFYNSELIIHTENNIENPLAVYISSKGNHARGNFNQRQIDIIIKEVLPTIDSKDTVGIITPFREQADKLIQEFSNSNIEADTVHKFQGRERDVIIISTVSNSVEANSFVDNQNLINVAVSRAKKRLILVTSSDMLENKRTNISDLVSYIKYNNFEVKESNVLSVFDTLYKNYSDRILMKYRNPKKISEYKSENIMYELISEILNYERYSSLSVLIHYPLNKIIKDYSLLATDEIRYVSNHLTHVDFLIYNNITKQPVLVIEVDGYSFHNKNETQLRRDEMKDNILKIHNVNMLRLNTTGSDEKNRIVELL